MFEVDEQHWPLVVVRFTGNMTLEEMERYIARQDGLIARKQPMLNLVIGEQLVLWETRVLRRMTEWTSANLEDQRRYSRAVALVITTPVARGMLKAALWMQPMPQPYQVCATVEGALAWLRGRAVEEGLPTSFPTRL